MNQLIKQKVNLPANIGDLQKFILIGREKLVSVRAYIRAIDKLGLAKEVREQKRDEANMLAGALLDAEARLGSLLKSRSTSTFKKGGEKDLPIGITKHQSSAFQTLADNQDIIEQVKADAEAEDDLPTRTEVLRRVNEKKREEIKISKRAPVLPVGLFDVIYADPPWEYEHCATDSRKIENQYPTMQLEDIKKLNIPSAENSVLLLWATAPKAEEALQVMNAWGFTYRTCAVWDKQVIGMGYWFRNQHELLLVGCKGKFSPPEQENRISSVYSEKRNKHSKKPDYYYSLIESMFPNGKYLELFARQQHSLKWAVYSNEI